MVSVERLQSNFGARINGCDLRNADDATLREILDALLQHRFVVIPGQQLENAEYVAFARRWGRPVHLIARRNVREDFPEMIVQSNPGGTPAFRQNVANHWHCDSSYEEEFATTTMLLGVESPEDGGETLFADLAGAYAALPAEDQERYRRMTVRHGTSKATMLPDESNSSYDQMPPEIQKDIVVLDDTTHPLVVDHPLANRRAFYGLGGSCYGIVGMNEAEGAQLLLGLRRYVTQDRFKAACKLMPGDVLIWNNVSVMHRATPIEYSDEPGRRRLNYRVSLKGKPDFA